MGIRSDDNTAVAGDILESMLKGNFPGLVFNSMPVDGTQKLIAGVREKDVKSLASVSMAKKC